MNTGLQSLLALRLRAEKEAEEMLATAIATHAGILAEQQRLEGLVAAARQRWQTERQRTTLPIRARDAVERDAFLTRLHAEMRREIDQAQRHLTGPLAAAAAAEEEARRHHLDARREREALDKHRVKQQAEAQAVADRRAEDTASELAQAAHVRRTR